MRRQALVRACWFIHIEAHRRDSGELQTTRPPPRPPSFDGKTKKPAGIYLGSDSKQRKSHPPSSSSSSPHEAAKPHSAICYTPCIRTLHLESHYLISDFCFPKHTTHLLVSLPWLGSSSSPPSFTTSSCGEPNFCTWVTQLELELELWS